ncbi:MAG: AAA family ATPase [Phycisphaerales bacterium]
MADAETTADRGAARSAPRREELEGGFDDIESVRRRCDAFRAVFLALRTEIGETLVGQSEVVDLTLAALFADGHVLLEGVPGLGKTLLVRALGSALGLTFSRIQFTPDLMPADITGTTLFVEDPATGRRSFTFRPGPIFAQLVLADEVNRATPKSQSALLEAMQEKSVTVGGQTRLLERPFFVMATQNPIEQEGTYPLPQAQLDRFLLKVLVPTVEREALNEVLRRTTAGIAPMPRQVLDAERILAAQRLARLIVVAPHVQDYIIRLVLSTHPSGGAYGIGPTEGESLCPTDVEQYIQVGVSPRGAQAIVSAAKIVALMDGRYQVSFADVRTVASAALRHRIERSFEAEADGVTTDDIVKELIARLPTDEERAASAPGGAHALAAEHRRGLRGLAGAILGAASLRGLQATSGRIARRGGGSAQRGKDAQG